MTGAASSHLVYMQAIQLNDRSIYKNATEGAFVVGQCR